jgi:histidine ammonia-lyase
MGSIAARKALKVLENVEKILAIELICACQAIDFKRPLKSSATIDRIHDYVRLHISHADEDRVFANDINMAIEIIQSSKIIDLAEDMLQLNISEFDIF